jgi:drug/metabolite transporter (DMT)-like permease
MKRDKESLAKATALIVISACSFGSLSTITVFVTRAGFGLVPAMFWRYLIAALALILVLRASVLRITRRRALQLVIVGGFAQALITYLSLRALDFLPVGPLAFLFYTYPAWVALISAATGREDLTLARLVALTVAMTGIVLMVGAPDKGILNPIGVILALGTAFMYALYLPVLHRIQADIPAGVSSFYLILGVLAAFLVAGLVGNELRMPDSPKVWGFVVLLALVSTVLAFASLIAGLRVLGPVRTSIVSTVEPFFTVMLGIVFLGERMTRSTVIGGVLIGAAVLLLQWTGRERTTAAMSGKTG